MPCPGVHCPGCKGGGALTLGPVVGLAVGVYLALHSPTVMHAIDTVLVCILAGEALAVVGMVAVLVLVFRAERPQPREAPRVVLRARAEQVGRERPEQVGREHVHVVTTAPQRHELEPGRVLASGRPVVAYEPARARVIRARKGASTGPGR